MNNIFVFLSLITDACENISVLRTVLFIKKLLNIVFILVPIGLIVMLSIDFAKNVISGKDDEMRKNLNIAIKRLIFVVALFLVPTIVKFAINSLGNFDSNYTKCLKVTEESINRQITINKSKCSGAGYEWDEITSECIIKSIPPEANITMSNGKTIRINSNSSKNNSSNDGSAAFDLNFILPLSGNSIRINSGFGDRHLDNFGTKFHNGLDLQARTGDSIYAVAAGTDYIAGYNSARGNVIVLKHSDNLFTVYQHWSKNLVTTGQSVSKGMVIAKAGATGNVSGAHLHFEVHTSISSQSLVFGGDNYNPCTYKSYKCNGGVNNGHSVTGTLMLK